MQDKLIIVESPTKAKTITKIIGDGYIVTSCMGHIKDLPKYRLGVDIENDFAPKYVVISKKKEILKKLKAQAAEVKKIYLATDPDREGEAISYHLASEIGKKNNISILRLILHEITPEGVLDALKNPTTIDMNKVYSQQARRVLDRLVGYKLSPLLKDVLDIKGLSAGRVQSVAVRIICEREEEIKNFKPQEYWSIRAKFKTKRQDIIETILEVKDEKKDIPNAQKAKELEENIRKVKNFKIIELKQKQVRRKPQAPFTTSKLQQEAVTKLNFSAKKTMLLAQQLYEGVELGKEGPVGLITYMRTDSVRIADYAKEKAKKFILEKYGKEYLPESFWEYKDKGKVQAAHEAIRPTEPSRTPDDIKVYLTQDQYKLYRLIWERFIASQMSEALVLTTTCKIKGDDFLFKVSGSVIKFKGFLEVYGKEEINPLPPLTEGEDLELMEVIKKQHFTQPPPRYTEASLVKTLEEKGIGRPSTYAIIIDTIQKRGYVKKQKGSLIPTELGKIVNQLLIKNFPDILNISFTANLESKLDEIEEGKTRWISVLKDFYPPFEEDLKKAGENMKDAKSEVNRPTEIKCEKCKKNMLLKHSRFGSYVCCVDFPEKCDYKISVDIVDGKIIPRVSQVTEEICQKCKSPLVIRQSRFGQFLACSNYPKCKFKKSLLDNAKPDLDNAKPNKENS